MWNRYASQAHSGVFILVPRHEHYSTVLTFDLAKTCANDPSARGPSARGQLAIAHGCGQT